VTEMDPDLMARAMDPDIRVGRGLLEAEVLDTPGTYVLVTQPDPLRAAAPGIASHAAATWLVESLDGQSLADTEERLPSVDRVVGLGGGMSMDAAKYVAWRRSLPLLLAPSIVSVDAVVTNTIAVRRKGSVVYEGFVVADRIVADLELIGAAPPRFNRAGAGDLLSIHTGRRDWTLGAQAGRIAFDEDLDHRAGVVLEGILGLGSEIGQVTDRALEAILRAYAEVNAILLQVGHAGPEEGSEHYFAYHAEAVAGRSFVHGELVSLGTLLMATLQDHDPARVRAFLDESRVAWQPAELGLDRSVLALILVGLPAFVRQAGLPYSIIDEADLGPAAVDALLDAVTG
jgi:glycerol-1-phosphate dehydrogenase [NAD(P)+]